MIRAEIEEKRIKKKIETEKTMSNDDVRMQKYAARPSFAVRS